MNTDSIMHPNIQQALKHLENASISGYFEEMDKVAIPKHLKPIYAEHKSKFMQGLKSFDFYQQLEVFAKEVEKYIAESKAENPQSEEKSQEKTIINNQRASIKNQFINPDFRNSTNQF